MSTPKKLSLLIFCVLLVALSVTIVGAQGSSRSYLVLVKGDKIPNGLAKKLQDAGAVVTNTIPQANIVVVTASNTSFASGLNDVRSVLPNVEVQWTPPVREVDAGVDFANPPTSGDNDFFFDLQWGHDAVNAVEAWNGGVRGAGVKVAVLDGGFDLDHPDLAPNILSAVSFVPGEGAQYALPGTFSHGSHVAGTIAAADNAFGVIGVAPEAKLILVKVLADSGSGSFESVIQGIVYAADQDADIINMSLGAYLFKNGFCDPDGCVSASEVAELKNAIGRATKYANKQGTLVIASAGNDAIDGDKDKAGIHLPSDAPQVISISATAPIGWATDPANAFLDYPASYTNYGSSVIEFAAPGGDFIYPGNENCTIAGLTRPCWVFDLVFSTGNNGWYWSAGTSMASPHAAGVAALLLSASGGSLNPSQLEAEMRRYAEDLGKPGNDPYYGAGRVSAVSAESRLVPLPLAN